MSLPEVAVAMAKDMDDDITSVVGIRAMQHKLLMQGLLVPR
jgi:hypothetical protein